MSNFEEGQGPEPEMSQNPPPIGMEAFFAAQSQLLQNLANTMANMQAQINNNNNQQHPPQPPPRDKQQEFMSHKPPTFSNSPGPLQLEDWLKSVKKCSTQLNAMTRRRFSKQWIVSLAQLLIGGMPIVQPMSSLTPSHELNLTQILEAIIFRHG